MKWFYRNKFWFLLFAAGYWFFFLRFPAPPPLRISIETTHFTTPTDGKGAVDLDVALNQAHRISPEQNAALPFLEIFGTALISPDARDVRAFLEILGAEASFPASGVFRPVPPGSESASLQYWPHPLRQVFLRPWEAAEFPDIASWITENDATLSKLSAIAEKPGFFWPHLPGKQPYGGNIFPPREVSVQLISPFRLLRARAMFQLGRHEFEGAWKDLHVALKAGIHLLHTDSLIGFLLGVLQFREGIQGTKTLLSKSSLSRALLERMNADLEELGPLPDGRAPIEYEIRYIPLSFLFHFSQRQFQGKAVFGQDTFGLERWMDRNILGQSINRQADEFIRLMETPTMSGRLAALNGRKPARADQQGPDHTNRLLRRFLDLVFLTFSWNKPARLSELFFDLMNGITLHRFEFIILEALTIQEELSLIKVGIRMRLFQAMTGVFPASLQELATGGYQPPLDGFSDRPYGFGPASDGFRLYSSGPDQRENNDDLVLWLQP
jgi:hypothetical protein